MNLRFQGNKKLPKWINPWPYSMSLITDDLPNPLLCYSFWSKLGTYMTKLDPDQTKIHLIGNNVTGNKKGEKLMKFLSKAMKPSKVKVESPLEFGQAGEWIMKLCMSQHWVCLSQIQISSLKLRLALVSITLQHLYFDRLMEPFFITWYNNRDFKNMA